MKIIQAQDYQELSRKAANIISAQITLNPCSVLGLATGSSPIGTYKRLVELCQAGDLDFSGITTVNLDEYCGLDPKDDQSYRYFMDQHLFSKVNIKPENTNVPDGLAANPGQECARYDNLIQSLGGIDLQLLGIGHNGHIGFNEPNDVFEKTTHCVELTPTTIEANARFFKSKDAVPKRAITMGIQSIMQAKKILLIVNGKNKADIFHRALYGPISPHVPASVLQFHPDLTVVASGVF